MKNRPYCYRAIFAVTSALFLSTMLPVTGASGDEAVDAKVETAGERAHFAQVFCQVPPERVAAYKTRLRNRLPDADDFDLGEIFAPSPRELPCDPPLRWYSS
nr:hypothetical protein [Paraburkholderia metrosideri]